MNEERCHICNNPSVNGPDGRQLNYCDQCDEPVCDNCSDCDYDMQGDPPHYVLTSWVCADNKCAEIEEDDDLTEAERLGSRQTFSHPNG